MESTTRPRAARIAAACLALLILAVTAASAQPAAAAPRPQPAPCATAAATAIAQRGAPYVWGAKGPYNVGYDCSGLTHWAWAAAGVDIGLSTYDQAAKGVSIPCRLSDIAGAATTCWQPGDLVFLRYTGGQHVAMYVGNGLFADAYNQTTGVIIHNAAADSYYQSHFWQARRIVECGNTTMVAPDVDATPYQPPLLEEIPDIIGPISFAITQCNDCNNDGTYVLPPREWEGSWPQGFEALNLPLVFRTVIDWLAWQVSEIARQVLCWLLQMLQQLVNFLSAAANVLIYGVNALLKMLILMWLSLKGYFFALWELLESVRQLLYDLASGLAGLADLGRVILELIVLFLALIGRIVALLGQIALALIGVIGWIGGLAIGFIISIQIALSGTAIPVQLSSTHVIYRATRGALEGFRDSQIGWVFPILWGMAYVAFITWLAWFLSKGEGA